ncbi:MAG: hypothetical protein CVV41_00140 [Candidatus Riflebacteria bacterium HGW-Riflebacteria-1]|jgi:hypothetical protein|nr:MAG: hypothetical protein CVV41_00140 [Candidatus Riflebacteria bacterium HGW-Riflebacteria-1]
MKFSFSLYFQITILFILLSIFSVIAAGSLNYFESRKIIVDQFNRSMRDIATTIGSSLNGKADDAAGAIMRISRHQVLYSSDSDAIQQFLQVAVDSSALFNNIYYFAPEGPLKAAAYADGRDVARYAGENFLNYADQEKTNEVYHDLVRALATRTPVFSAFFKSATGTLMNSFIVPVTNVDGSVVGLLSCGIAMDTSFKLLEMMNTLKPHPNGYVALIDAEGRVLLSAGDMPADLSPERDWLTREDSLISCAGYLQAVFRMEKTGLGVCSGLPETAVSEMLKRLQNSTTLFTMVVGIIACLAGILAAYILVSPITALVKGLRSLQDGKPAARIDCRASGEIAEAISIYNELREKEQKARAKAVQQDT